MHLNLRSLTPKRRASFSARWRKPKLMHVRLNLMHVKPKGMHVRLNLRYVGFDLRDAEMSVIFKCKMALRKPKVMRFSWNLMPVRIGCRSGNACVYNFVIVTYCRREVW